VARKYGKLYISEEFFLMAASAYNAAMRDGEVGLRE